MTQKIYYTYLGEEGIVTTTQKIPGINGVKKILLQADPGKKLTKDGKTFIDSILIPESHLALWKEVVGQD